MKAILWTKYGSPDGLQPGEVAKPVPKDNEVLIKIAATTVTAGDCEVRSLKFPPHLALPLRLYIGLIKPKRIRILGQELAGEVESVGKDVTKFKVGDQVFAQTGFGMGAYAEYICLPAEQAGMSGPLALKPQNMTFEEAAAVPTGGLEALHFIRKGQIKNGEKVLINGAGGSIGTIAVQLAKHLDGVVTAVDSKEKLDTLQALGADHVIDYKQEDFTKSGKTYDVIFDVVGKSSFGGSIRSLKKNGRYLLSNAGIFAGIRGKWAASNSNKQVITGAAPLRVEDLISLREMIEEGKLKVVIDRRYLLEEMVEAHKYVESGAKKGNVIITVTKNTIT